MARSVSKTRRSKSRIAKSRRRSNTSLKNILSPVGNAYNFTNDVSQEIVNALSNVVGGLVDGANIIVDTTGDIVDQAGTMFDVYATQIFKGAGGIAKRCADGLGTVIRQVPIVGGGVAYVIESTGGGVYYIVVAVGKFAGSAARRTGKLARRSTDLIVYTLTQGKDTVQDTGSEVTGLVKRLRV